MRRADRYINRIFNSARYVIMELYLRILEVHLCLNRPENGLNIILHELSNAIFTLHLEQWLPCRWAGTEVQVRDKLPLAAIEQKG